MGCRGSQWRLPCSPAVIRNPTFTLSSSKVQANDPGLHHHHLYHYQNFGYNYACVHDESCCHGDSSPVLHSRHVVSSDKRFVCTLCEAGHLSQAIDLLSQLKTPIHISNYVPLFKACIAHKAPSVARQVYAHLVQHSSGVTPLLADYLAITFAKCGAIDDASHLFYAASHRTVLSWTALIAAFTDCGCADDALQTFRFMQEDGVEPDSYTFVSLFKACGIIKNLKEGMRLHAEAHQKGLTSNAFVANTLVSMYIKCGDALQAEEVFRGLSRRNIASWNGMIAVLIKTGLIGNVLLAYRQLCEELKDPDPISLVFALQACGFFADAPVENRKFEKINCLEIGLALHSYARMRSHESNLFVGTALINMYAKCGAIKHAQHVFEALPRRDLVSWNTMLSALVQQNDKEKALQLYTLMDKEGLSPDESTFMLLFQACGSVANFKDGFFMDSAKHLHIGQALHLNACKQGLDDTLAVSNSLVMMYGKLAAVMEAECLFNTMEQLDVVSWSIMISVYVDQGSGKKGLSLYRQMQEEGVAPDQHVLVLAVRACSALALEEATHNEWGGSSKGFFYEFGQAIFVDTHRSGFWLDSYVGNVLINMYSKCVGVVEAEDVFLSLSDQDVVAWTTMLSSYVDHGQARKALQLYIVMHEDCVVPNELTLIVILHGCGALVDSEKDLLVKKSSWKLEMLEIVRALHSDATRVGLMTDTSVRIAFITAYGKCSDVLQAESLFVTTSHWDAAIRNALFSVYLELGLGDNALCLFKDLQRQHPLLDEVGIVLLVHACTGSANLETCRELHFYIIADGYGKSISLAASLVHTHASCASMEDMQAAFNEVVGPDAVCWTACIDGNAGLGNFVMSADIFERLRLAGVEPDEVVLTALLLSCTNSGSIAEGLEYFISFRENYSVMLHVKHYGTIVTLLGGAGNLMRAENFRSRMPMEADSTIWSSLLRACDTHSDAELARKSFTQAVLKEQIESSIYVLMSNMSCSDRHEKEAAEKEYVRISL